VNYLRYYSGKIVDSGLTRDKLDEDNAEDIYDEDVERKCTKSRSNVEYGQKFFASSLEKFSLSQFSVPPLSAPLVLKTFKTNLGKTPYEFFDEFNANSVNAASIKYI
jgi:hypothetical protein